MTDEEFSALYEKHLAGTCTPEEQQRFDAYLSAQPVPAELPWEEASMGAQQQVRQAILAQLTGSLQQQKAKSVRPLYRQWWALAASVVLLLTVGLYQWHAQRQQPVAATTTVRQNQPTDFKPGRNKALLTLADGSTINLDDAQKGLLAQQGASTVQKDQAGHLVYKLGADQAEAHTAATILQNCPLTLR